jgi:predicted metal-dependent hydrolase
MMDAHTVDPEVAPPLAGRPTGWDSTRGRSNGWEHGTLRAAVLEGGGLFNTGAYHAAHDCFEAEWFNYGAGSTESAFCHGMVQVAAGAYKWTAHGDPDGTRSLCSTALQYLAGVPADFYGLDVPAVRAMLLDACADPATIAEGRLRVDARIPRQHEPETVNGDR